jgi:hypothetical protein
LANRAAAEERKAGDLGFAPRNRLCGRELSGG